MKHEELIDQADVWTVCVSSGAPAAAGCPAWKDAPGGHLWLSSTWAFAQTGWTTTTVLSQQRWPLYGRRAQTWRMQKDLKGRGLCCTAVGRRGGRWWVTTETLDKLLIEFWLLFSLRVPQDCFSSVPLLAHDPDGDHVKCSFAADATVPANVSLDQVVSAWTRFPSK